MTVAGLIAALERLPLAMRGTPILFPFGEVTHFWATPTKVVADEDRVIIEIEPFDG